MKEGNTHHAFSYHFSVPDSSFDNCGISIEDETIMRPKQAEADLLRYINTLEYGSIVPKAEVRTALGISERTLEGLMKRFERPSSILWKAPAQFVTRREGKTQRTYLVLPDTWWPDDSWKEGKWPTGKYVS